MLAQVDRLFDPKVVNRVETVVDGVQQPTTASSDMFFGQVLMPAAENWRSGWVVIPIQLLQDSGIDIEQMLVASFAVRFARGIGAANVATLLSEIQLGRTATGSATNTGGSETGANSVGTDDLEALMNSVDAAYVVSSKCRWAMNWSTLTKLWTIKDKRGHPTLKPEYSVDGEPMLLGKPVALCPSFEDIGTGNVPIAFGDFGKFAVRVVKDELFGLQRRSEAAGVAERFQVGFQALMRTNAGVLWTSAGSPVTGSPVKYLQNA